MNEAPSPPALLPRLRELLGRHRLVENVVHRQAMQRHDLVENLVHQQHLAELANLLARCDAAAIAQLFAHLDDDEQRIVWQQLPEARLDDLLLALPDALRGTLIALRPITPSGRVSVYEVAGDRLHQRWLDDPAALAKTAPVWIDLLSPRPSELDLVGRFLGVDLPDPQTMSELEASARFYRDDAGAVHLYSDFLHLDDGTSRSVRVAFILHRGCLVSIRQEKLLAFALQGLRARSAPEGGTDGRDLLLGLYAADVEYSADALESVDTQLDQAGRQVLQTRLGDRDAALVLAAIAAQEDLNGRIRRNLLDSRRALSMLTRARLLSPLQGEDARQILRDIDSLDGHTSFLFDKINFLMDATVGFININQNKIIKTFSVASVALLPPTLIASIYGMNFRNQPELEWTYGYPFALGLMVVSVVVPMLLFRRRGWFD